MGFDCISSDHSLSVYLNWFYARAISKYKGWGAHCGYSGSISNLYRFAGE